MNIRRIAATASLSVALLVTALPAAHASAQAVTVPTVGVTSQSGGGGELDWPWGLVAAVSDWPWGGPGTDGSSAK